MNTDDEIIIDILVIDIETTHLDDYKNGCIVELGMCSLNFLTGKTKPLFNKLFKEKHINGKHHKAWIFENTSMKIEDVRNAKDIEVYREQIQTIFDKYSGRITAWNRDFDVGWLKSRGFKFGKPMTCPMKDSATYFKLPGKFGHINKWASAQEAWNKLFPNTQKIEEHRAMSDALMEAKIIYQLIQNGVYSV